MTERVSRRGLLQAATALGISTAAAGLAPVGAFAEAPPRVGPPEYYNERGPVVPIAPGLQIGYRDDWLGAPWEKPEVMLMVHGNRESGVVWYGWVPRLGSEYRLIRPDLPGFGHSTIPASFEWTHVSFAKILAQFLDKLGVESAHVIGTKTGGGIALQFAANYPTRTKTLVLITAPLSPPSIVPGQLTPEVADPRDQSKRLGTSAPKPMVDFYSQMMFATLPEPSTSLRKMVDEGRASGHLESIMPQVTTPTLLIISDRNAQVSVPQAFANQQKIPHSRLLVITSDAYHIILANTDEVVANVRAFIQEARKGV